MNATKEESKSTTTKSLDELGINVSTQYLEQNAYQVLASPWTYGEGKVDIIAKGEDALSFIEVKTRKSYKIPKETITAARREEAEKAAMHYLTAHDGGDCKIRFDVISVNILDGARAFLRHHKDALSS